MATQLSDFQPGGYRAQAMLMRITPYDRWDKFARLGLVIYPTLHNDYGTAQIDYSYGRDKKGEVKWAIKEVNQLGEAIGLNPLRTLDESRLFEAQEAGGVDFQLYGRWIFINIIHIPFMDKSGNPRSFAKISTYSPYGRLPEPCEKIAEPDNDDIPMDTKAIGGRAVEVAAAKYVREEKPKVLPIDQDPINYDDVPF